MSAGISNQKSLPTVSETQWHPVYCWDPAFLYGPPLPSPFSQRHSQDPSGCEDLSQRHRWKKHHVWSQRREAEVWAEIYCGTQNYECLEAFGAENNAHLILFPPDWNKREKKLQPCALLLLICTVVLARHACATGGRLYWGKASPKQAVFHFMWPSCNVCLFGILGGK